MQFSLLILFLVTLGAGFKHQTYQDPDRLFDLSVSFDAGLSKRDPLNDPVIERSEGFLSKTVPVQILTGNNRLFKANNNRFFDVKFEEKLTGSNTLSKDGRTNNGKDFRSVNPKIIQKLDFVSDNTVMKTLDGIIGEIDFVDKLNRKAW